ncbi:hypothetical protein DL768_007795 [Monosporascus sp. mg162]|nr:hypothetical protein DL768_007795 [Monosporascus sp. mg162]
MSNPEKAARYLQLLEDARCEGRWDEVPELVRKVRKHANDRSCLTTTAETEHAIVKASQNHRPGSRPGSAHGQDLDVAQLLPKLRGAFDQETKYPEDRFQAQVCVGWLLWTAGEYDEAQTLLPQNLETEYAKFPQPETLSEWTKVCSLKAAYLKANCLSRSDLKVEALAVLESALAVLSSFWESPKGRKQLRFWAELFLTEYCMLQARALEREEKSLAEDDSLAAFRTWARYWETFKAQGSPLEGGYGFKGAVPRRRVWDEYYAALSGILQQDLPFPTGYMAAATSHGSARNELRMELKRVEAAYEGLLLSETTFPRADEQRREVENFVAIVMRNWTVLSGWQWHESDLGQGGKEDLSRGVLDILYRAATKTFHSTAILRYLFIVHLSVAEFDLAFSAFDSYLEIVKRGKARIDKTGHLEPNLDDDATVLETISQAITALCQYGFYDAAEKAYGLAIELEEMLQKLPTPLPNTDGNIPPLEEENGEGVVLHPRISSHVHGLAWQAIGLAQAQWSRATYDASIRTEVQSKAIRSFQRSLSPDTGNPTDVRTLFTLGLLLAEQRELSPAIEIVKAALMSNKKSRDEDSGSGSYWRERSLIPLWHLLALLLSARQDFIMAARACEGAFEQFDDPVVLFGSQSLDGTYRSDHLNEVEAKTRPEGLVDQMDDLEKEGIIEVKMTQLALLELLEGPEVAVNASHELLALYTRLFGTIQRPNSSPGQKNLVPPKSSAGTIRTLKGSIFGTRTSRNPPPASVMESEEPATASDRPQTAQTVATTMATAPTIQVTKENGSARHSRQSSRPTSSRGRSNSTRRNSLKKRNPSTRRPTSSGSAPRRSSIVDSDFFTPLGDSAARERPDFFDGRGITRSGSTASTVRGSMNNADPLVLDSLSYSNPLPTIHFPEEQRKRQRQTILIKVWLMIAAFYRRAKMHKDCKGALEEAKKIVECLEAEIAQDTSGGVTLRNPGWGGRKSADELWSDMRSEMGYLALSEGAPFAARGHFEEALLHYPDHPSAIVGLSNILLDVYSEVLLPPPTVPGIGLPEGDATVLGAPSFNVDEAQTNLSTTRNHLVLPSTPLGLANDASAILKAVTPSKPPSTQKSSDSNEELPAPYRATSLPLVDRLAARDRAYALLSGLTKLGSGWNYSDAWFALARAYEESGQLDKAKEALWWCVELEEGMGVRDWKCVGVGGYVL